MREKLKKTCASVISLALCAGMFCALPVAAAAVDVNETIDNDDTNTDHIGYTSASLAVSGAEITEGSKFRIECSGDEANIVLILSDGSGIMPYNWLGVAGTRSTPDADGNYYVEYSYEQITAAWDGATLSEGQTKQELSAVTSVRAATWGLWDSATSTTLSKTTAIKSIEFIPAQTTEPSEYIYENAGPVTVTLPSSSSRWPSEALTISPAVTVYPGAVVEYDVTLANNEFTKFYTEPKFNWTGIQNKTFVPSDFTANGDGTYTAHMTAKYELYGSTAATTIENLSTLRIQFQNAYNGDGADYNYTGDVTVTNITVKNGAAPVAETAAEAASISETTADGSLGYLVNTIITDAANLSGAVWRITNGAGAKAEVSAKIDTAVQDTEIVVGLVLTATAVGDNTISKVEFVY